MAQDQLIVPTQAPLLRHTCCTEQSWPTEHTVFRALEQIKPTFSGLDGLPAWYLKLAAPAPSELLAWLFKKSLSDLLAPVQWKTACITPVPKISQPAALADYRPISLTPILSRLLEKIITRHVLYPILADPVMSLEFSDQYGFRPTGSTTAALISILISDIASLLQSCPYVYSIALDLSKAFDTVRHHTLLSKFSSFHLDDNLYNWLVSYFTDRSHSTKAHGVITQPLAINASIVQGSSIGPTSYVINASDLKTIIPGNKMHKYADGTYLLVPAFNNHHMQDELDHIETW